MAVRCSTASIAYGLFVDAGLLRISLPAPDKGAHQDPPGLPSDQTHKRCRPDRAVKDITTVRFAGVPCRLGAVGREAPFVPPCPPIFILGG